MAAPASLPNSAEPAASQARAAAQAWIVLSFQKMLQLQAMRPVRNETVDRIACNAPFGRLAVAWTLGLDPGNGISVLTGQAALARTRLEERLCLLRFRTREAAYFASRRAATFLRAQMSASQQAGRFAGFRIREIPIEESQAPAAGGRQTR